MRKVIYLLFALFASANLSASHDESNPQFTKTSSVVSPVVHEESSENIEVFHSETSSETIVERSSAGENSDNETIEVSRVGPNQEDLVSSLISGRQGELDNNEVNEIQTGHISRAVYESALRKLNKNQMDAVSYAACTERLWYGLENIFEVTEFSCLLGVAIFAKLGYTDLAFYFSIGGLGSKMIEHFAAKRRKDKREIYMEIIRQYEENNLV